MPQGYSIDLQPFIEDPGITPLGWYLLAGLGVGSAKANRRKLKVVWAEFSTLS